MMLWRQHCKDVIIKNLIILQCWYASISVFLFQSWACIFMPHGWTCVFLWLFNDSSSRSVSVHFSSLVFTYFLSFNVSFVGFVLFSSIRYFYAKTWFYLQWLHLIGILSSLHVLMLDMLDMHCTKCIEWVKKLELCTHKSGESIFSPCALFQIKYNLHKCYRFLIWLLIFY